MAYRAANGDAGESHGRMSLMIPVPAMRMPIGTSSFFILLCIVLLLFFVIQTASQHRRYSSQTQQKLCRGCGASHPNFAAFCRRCGRKL